MKVITNLPFGNVYVSILSLKDPIYFHWLFDEIGITSYQQLSGPISNKISRAIKKTNRLLIVTRAHSQLSVGLPVSVSGPAKFNGEHINSGRQDLSYIHVQYLSIVFFYSSCKVTGSGLNSQIRTGETRKSHPIKLFRMGRNVSYGENY